MSSVAVAEVDRPGRQLAPSGVIGGIGGLAFVGSVIVQNALRAGFPSNDAGAAEVVAYYADHRTVAIVLAVFFPIGGLGFAAFMGAVLSRCAKGGARSAALSGALGAAGIIATFTMLLASDLALSGYVHRGKADESVVEALWVLHSAVFGLLLASIGITLAGLSAASAAVGLVASWWRGAGLVGGVLLLVASATTPAIIDASPIMVVGLLGFLVWVVFVVTVAVTLLRRPEPPAY